MAWIKWHVAGDGVRFAHVQWRDRKGRRHSEGLGPVTEDVAEAVARDYEQTREGKTAKGEKTAAGKALAGFLEHREFLRRSDRTVAYYEEKLAHLFDWLAPKPMERWVRGDFQRYVAAQTWSPRRVRMATGAFRAFYRWATSVKDPPLRVLDVTAGFMAPDPETVEPTPYTPKQAARLLDVVRDHPYLRRPVALGLHAAFDLGSIRALTWEEIDARTAKWVITGERVKTGAKREIPVTVALRKYLEPRATSGIVCRDLPKSDSSLLKVLHRAMRKAEIEEAGWHRLRHSCLSLLGALKVDVATIRAIACHAPGSKETLRYLHTDHARQLDAVTAASQAVARAGRA